MTRAAGAPLLAVAASAAAPPAELVDHVDPRIGAGGVGWGAGSHNPGVQRPFGALRLGPDTSPDALGVLEPGGFDHFGGYHASDTHVRAFSHTHLVGAGVGDWGNVGLMPYCGDLPEGAVAKKRGGGWRSPLNKTTESATAWRYAAELGPPASAAVELAAAGTHAGVHQYTFAAACPAAARRSVVVDVCHTWNGDASQCQNASVVVSADGLTVEGSVLMHGALSGRGSCLNAGCTKKEGGVWVHFSLSLHPAPAAAAASARVWAGGAVLPGALRAAASGSAGAVVAFPPGTASVGARIGISFVSVAAARANAAAQLGAAPLEAVVADARAAWRRRLGGVEVAGGVSDAAALAKFATALYHAHCAPTTYSESDGAYLGFDGAVHNVTEWGTRGGTPRAYMSDMSLWDVHRTQLPWLTFSDPAASDDVVRSLQAMQEQGGAMGRWPLANVYTGCMLGNHGVVAVADSILKSGGAAGDAYDVPSLYRGMLRQVTEPTANAGRGAADLADYNSLGYVAFETSHSSASTTLAWAFDDWAVATVADAVGDAASAAMLRNRSTNYRNLFSAKRGLFCPRKRDGSLDCPLDGALPYFMYKDGSPGGSFVESNALEYTMSFVPQDPAGLVALFPSKAAFAEKLDKFFSDSRPAGDGGKWRFGNVLANAYYWAGNEPDLLAVWLFAFAARPDLTAKWSRWLNAHEYGAGPNGLPGNDDFGTMSAWYVWASLGLYPLPGSPTFIVGSPSFERAVIRRTNRQGAAADVTIVAHNASAAAVYVQRAEVNGRELAAPLVDWADIGPRGGTLEFWMGEHPSAWGRE